MARKTKPVADLAELDEAIAAQETGSLVPINNIDGTPIGFSIRVAGPDSALADQARDEMSSRLLDRGSVEPLTNAETQVQTIQYLARVTTGWEPKIVLDAQELPCNYENAVKLYTRFRFIREQVDAKANSRARFLPLSSDD